MQSQALSQVVEKIKEVIGVEAVREAGFSSGFIQRERSITAPRFFATLMCSMGGRRLNSIADLTRDFNADHGSTINYKPFYDRLNTSAFPAFMQSLYQAMIQKLSQPVIVALKEGPFAQFDDILVHDGSSFAVHDELADIFPGRFTDKAPAAVELHCTMSLLTDNVTRMDISPDSTCERHFLPEPSALRNKLLLVDRGYDSMAAMDAIHQAGGSYLVRARSNHDPRVITVHSAGRGYRRGEGLHLKNALRKFPTHQPVDLDVCREKSGKLSAFSRMVCIYNSKIKTWVRFLTNLSRADFSAQDIASTYALRWQVELLFKDFKSESNLHRFVTRKENIVLGLIWSSLCAAAIKRLLAHLSQRQGDSEHAISTQRTARCGAFILEHLVTALYSGARSVTSALTTIATYLCKNARRSNMARDRQSGRLNMGLECLVSEKFLHVNCVA